MAEQKGTQAGLAGFFGGSLLGVIGGLLLSKPAAAAAPELKLDYLVKLLETQLQGTAEIITWLEKINTAQGAPGVPGEPGVPGIEVTVLTPWKAKEPEAIFNQAIRSVGAFHSDAMVNWTEGKRILFKVESSLDQAVQIQLVGNISDTFTLATNIGPALPCVANGNISVGPAWDDWHPFIGVLITTAIAPTAGILNIWAVVQS